MLRLRSCILTRILSSPSTTYPVSPLHRLLLSTTASPVPASPAFAVADYLVATCGLTRAQALKASTKISHLKSPTKPDAVLTFLSGLGLSSADVAALVAKDPQFLCADVEKTLSPVLIGLTGHGLSQTEIARLVSLAGEKFRNKSVVPKLLYYLHLFGSIENMVRILERNVRHLSLNIERVVKPKVAFLQECGLGVCDIAELCLYCPWLLTCRVERVRAMVECAEGLGVPRGSGMFKYALRAIQFHSEEHVLAKVDYLKKTLRWSDVEVGIAVSKGPYLLRSTKAMLQRSSDFLISEVGLEPAYIARRPALLCYSLEGRLRPRYYVLKFLKENGLLEHKRSYNAAVCVSEKVFVEKYICPHKEAAPQLVEDYATTCRGELPTRFIFAGTCKNEL